MDERVRELLKKYKIKPLSSEKFQYDNHEMDNRPLFHLGDIIRGYGWGSIIKMIGYTEHPNYKEWVGPGLMFEYDDGSEAWCHGFDGIFDYESIKSDFKNEL